MPVATEYGFQNLADGASRSSAAMQGGGEDFNTFLRMLTTQITHQDPMNPLEGSDFAVQLATFSGVEQQTRTNQLLEALAGQMTAADLSALSGWIGKEARSTAPVWFGDQPLTIDIRPAHDADEVVLVIRDGFDRVIGHSPIGVGEGQIDWYGRDADGQKLPDGFYRFEIESLRDGEVISAGAAEAYARVTEARLQNGQSVLILEGGGEVPASEVTALRNAGG